MLNCYMKKPLYVNNGLREYCNKATNESIRKLTEKYTLERKTKQYTTLIYDEDGNQTPNLGCFAFFVPTNKIKLML